MGCTFFERWYGDLMPLRPYQEDAKAGIYASWRAGHRSSLLVLPTGCGKTVVFNDIAADGAKHGRRTLILAHRKELIAQAADKLQRFHGIEAAVEMADRKEAQEAGSLFGDGPPVVVASIQSMVRRLKRFAPDYFDLVIADECHHSPSRTWAAVLEHFSEAKVLGVTATPDRGDKVALGQIFDDVGYELQIQDAITEGWLVPITQTIVETKGIDLSKVRITAGDFNAADLDAVMSEAGALHEIAAPIVEEAGDRQTIVFCVTVAHAYLLAEVMREYVRARAERLHRPLTQVEALDGTSSPEDRADVLRRFHDGDTQFLLNCALFTEGFDEPAAACVAIARPTKSRALYAQMLGRGTRTLPGVVDSISERGFGDERRAAITKSNKPDLLILDFAGNAGKHSLANAVDVLDGEATKPEVSLAKGMVARGEVKDILEALRLAREQIAERERVRIREEARKGYRTRVVDPFQALGVDGRADSWGREISEKQAGVLDRAGIDPKNLDRAQASRLITALVKRREDGAASFKQAKVLMRAGLERELVAGLSFEAASALVDELASNRWRWPSSWDERFPATAQ
jgi:superfamily II DNA or RNA helicase